jgi:hypothetical protein
MALKSWLTTYYKSATHESNAVSYVGLHYLNSVGYLLPVNILLIRSANATSPCSSSF